MNLTKIALESNRIVIMLVLMMVSAGIIAYGNLSRDAMPPYTVRVCAIVTQFPGASPQRVEELITEKVEKVVQELSNLKDVKSESRTGISIVHVTLNDDVSEKDLQPTWDKLRRKITSIQNEMPSGSYGPNVKDDDLGVVYGIMIGMEADGFSYYDMKQFSDQIKDDLVQLEDASKIDVAGIQDETVYVEFDNAQLTKVGLTAGQLQKIITETNIVFSGGQVSLEDERIVLEPTGNYDDVDDLKKTLIPVGIKGATVELGDITTIRREYTNPTARIVKVNGKQGLVISVALKDGKNLIRMGEEVDKRIAYWNNKLPIGIQLSRTASQDHYVEEKVQSFVGNVVQSIVIVLAVMLLFLGMRTGFIVASLIPLTMIMTLLLMGFFGIGLNQVTLAALIMALGMLVDNAIVVSETIMGKVEDGMPPKDAAIEASQELMIPLLVSSLTTSAAFLAFFLAENSMGEIMGPLFSVITIALLCSWLLAMTVITMLGVAFIRIKKKKAVGENEEEQPEKKTIFDRLMVYYSKVLDFAMRRPIIVIGTIVLMFIGSLMLFPLLPFIFFPDSDRNLVTVDINMPLGTKVEKTAEVVADIEAFIEKELRTNDDRTAGITDWSAFIKAPPISYDLGYSPGQSNPSYAHMLLNTSSFTENNVVMAKLNDFCFENLPNADINVALLGSGGGGGSDVEVRVSGNNPEELFSISDAIKQQMTQIDATTIINDDWGPKIKKFIIDIDRDKANRAGVTNQDIAVSLQTSLIGFNSGSYRDGDDNIPITMRSLGSQELDVQQLNGISIFSQSTGRNVPLGQVATLETAWQAPEIHRRQLRRTITISCNAREGFTASDVTTELKPWLNDYEKTWKEGYTYELGGEAENSTESMGAVIAKLPIAAFIILILLIAQFNSFRKTFIVVATIPLGLIGVILGLLVFQSFFGFMAFLGVISLAGIVINNAIVLLDRIKMEQDKFKRNQHDAIVAACLQRFRPILLTTFTTALGLIPLYLGGGLMWEPMAISIMIGLLFATVITLLFVPSMYKLLFKEEE
ncbi:MAG: multidrug efflux pump subunit AcrB [Paraglaciecola sp.]|jgi:multidrug efflux pump subunit AcrB